jgi:hypothetical protein
MSSADERGQTLGRRQFGGGYRAVRIVKDALSRTESN